MGHNSRTFSKDHKNAKSSKEGTKKNIKTSLNKLQARNQTLFGPPGKNFYNPNSRYDYGGAYDMYPFGGVNTKTHTHFDEGGPNTNPTTPAPAPSLGTNQYMDEYDKKLEQYLQYQKALNDEQSRVTAVREKAASIAANKAKSPNKKTRTDLSYIKQGAYYCNTHTGECFQDAGATTPEGKKVPVIPGNLQWDSKMPEYGFQWVDQPQAGDVAREQLYRTSDYQGNPLSPGWYTSHSGVVTKGGDKPNEVMIGNAPGGSRFDYANQSVAEMVHGRNPKDYKMRYQRYVGNLPKYEKQIAEMQDYFKNTPLPTMQPIQAQLTQSPDEREIIIPQQSTMANLSSRKKGGSLSGAPHNGQPTAETFFQQTWIPPGPVGFYRLGGQNTDGIAFPQQVPDNYFFAGVPWQNNLGHFAYGGGLPGGANQGMPCLECGGYMEMGGGNQFGGGVDGGMDYFKDGGHWIQEAKTNIRNNLRAIAKKNYGGVNDTALDPQGDYVGGRKDGFKKSIALNFGLATADDIAKNYDAMSQNASMGSTPMAAYGYNVNEDPYGGYNPQTINNYNMAQGMLDNANAKTKANNNSFFSGVGNFAKAYYDPNRNHVNWDLKKAEALANLEDEPDLSTSKYGGGLYKAAFGVDAFGNPAPNQMGPLSQQETNQRTIDNARMLPWNQQAGPQGPPQFQGGWYPRPLYPSYPYRINENWDRGSQLPPQRGSQNDPGFDPRYREQNPNYWTSQNGQTRYDYGDVNSWNNVNQNRGTFGGNWNTPGWNTPNPYFNAMFGDPNLSTRLAGITTERGFMGDLFNRSGKVRNPKKITYRFNTYVNPQTGKVETKAVPVQVPAGPQQTPANKPAAEKGFQDQVAEDKKKAAAANDSIPYAEVLKDETPQPSARQKQIQDYMRSQLTPAGSSQRPADQAIPNNQGYNPGFPVYNSNNPLKTVPASSGNGWDNATKGQLAGPRAEVMNTPAISDRQKAIENSMRNQFAGPGQQSSNSSNAPINMDPRQMQNMPMTSQPQSMPNELLPPGSPQPVPLTPATGNYDFMNDVQYNNQRPGPVSTPPMTPATGNYDFMSDLQNNQRPGPIAQQAYGGMPDYSYAYGGYLPMGKYGYTPDYEENLMGAGEAEFAQGANPNGGYALTGTRKKDAIAGTDWNMGIRGVLGAARNMFSTDKPYLEKYMAQATTSDRLNPEVQGYRGNELQTGMGTGSQFGAQSSSPGAYTKSGGMIYANGGAYQTGVPVDLTDDEIQAIMAAGGTVRYV